MRDWLQPPDPSSNFRESYKKHLAGTRKWFLKGDQYQRWKSSAGSVLWTTGKSGCGKTILSSAIIKDLEAHCERKLKTAVLYFYFDSRNESKMSVDSMIRFLVVRLHSVLLPAVQDDPLSRLRNECVRKAQPRPFLSDLVQVLKRLIEMARSVYIVLDALDEAAEAGWETLTDEIHRLVGWKIDSLHLLFTSQRIGPAAKALDDITRQVIDMDEEDVDGDIRYFIQHSLQSRGFSKWNSDIELLSYIERKLVQYSKGM